MKIQSRGLYGEELEAALHNQFALPAVNTIGTHYQCSS